MTFSAISSCGEFRTWYTNKYSQVKECFKACGEPSFLLFNYKIVKRTGPKNKYFDELVFSYFRYLEIFNDKEIAYNYCVKLSKAWENFGFNIGFPWEDVINSLALLYDESINESEEFYDA